MDLYPEENTQSEQSQNSENNMQIFKSETSDGFSSDLMISNDQLKNISKTQLTLEKEKIFKMPNVLSQVMKKAFSRKNEILYCVSTKELSVDIHDATGKVYLPLITKEEINKRLSSLKPEVRKTMSMVHLGAVKILLKAQFRNGIDTPIKIALIDDRINSRRDCLLGAAKGNLAYGKFMFTVYPKFGISLNTQRLNQTLSLIHDFENKNLMNKGDKVMTITYIVGYALTNSHYSIDYQSNATIELEDVFQEIGNIQQSEFCAIQNDECNWAIDIAQNKALLGAKTKTQIGNSLQIGNSASSSNTENELARVSQNIDLLKNKLKEICGE
uniref:Movement protein n=1 Tax=Cauliflower mosaic virus TaxID=10641 RepID=U5KP03_9VIRU|nr:movement protein [Cauliflower mosaic virus]BAO53270.1 movement protein [Cauliflower mosaic virus]